MGPRYSSIDKLKPPSDTRTGWGTTKVVLRVISILVAFGLVGVGVQSTLRYVKEFDFQPDLAYYTAPIAIATVIWDVVEFITMCARAGRGIHPGAHVGVQLIFVLSMIPHNYLLFQATVTLDAPELKAYHEFDWYRLSVRICAILMSILTLIRFILFVGACVDTDKRRKWWKRQARRGGDEAAVHLVSMPAPAPYITPTHAVITPAPYYDPPKQVAVVGQTGYGYH